MKHLHNDQIGAEKCVCDYQGGSLTLWSILDYLDYDKVVYIIQVFIPYEAANIIAMDGTAVCWNHYQQNRMEWDFPYN